MAVPKFFEFFGHVLSVLYRSNTVLTAQDLREKIAAQMMISPEDRAVLLPSGRQRTFDNRVNWAITYLKKAGLVDNPSRGKYRITDLGKRAYQEAGDRINLRFLENYDAFREFRSVLPAEDNSSGDLEDTAPGQENTPQDVIDIAYKQINDKLADDLLLAIKDKPPAFFEKLVVDLLLKMGYGGAFDDAGIVIGQSGDEGIDGVIREDKLGFSNIYLQAKRWEASSAIGRPEIQKFVGALAGQGAQKGLFITTANFTKDARLYVQRQLATKIVLVDGTMLTKLMIEYDIGVSTICTYPIKKVDTDFFSDDDA